MRSAATTTLLLLALAACAGRQPRLPEGIAVVEEETPPPPPAIVEEAQRRLQAADLYQGPIDGELTPAVRVALARFQRAHDLPVTGALDEATAAALGLRGLTLRPASPESPGGTGAAEGPRASELLALDEVPERSQPPPGALDEARAAAAALLAAGIRSAAEEVERAGRLLQDGVVEGGAVVGRGARPPAEEGEPPPAVGDLLGAEQAAARAQIALASARREAFGLLLEARRAGGWALLPQPLIDALEIALQRRALLVRGRDGRLGPDDEAAIRWIERSVGLEATGVPSLPLLEALGIDPGPMFELP